MPHTVSASAPVRALLAGAIDYAGLFPPANLDLTRALEEYLSIASTDERWALGRFVIPVASLAELAHLLRQGPARSERNRPIRVSSLIGADIENDLGVLEQFGRQSGGMVSVDAVEIKASGAAAARDILAALPHEWSRYLEIAPGGDLSDTLDVLSEGGAFAKIRTGGVTPDAFPDAEDVLDFLEACVRRKLPFKATAGLHHAVRGEYRLTYAPAAPTAPMYGYLNLFLAATTLWTGQSRSSAKRILLASDRDAFRFGGDSAWVLGQAFSVETLAEVRSVLMHGFGSCSFREPLDELSSLASA